MKNRYPPKLENLALVYQILFHLLYQAYKYYAHPKVTYVIEEPEESLVIAIEEDSLGNDLRLREFTPEDFEDEVGVIEESLHISGINPKSLQPIPQNEFNQHRINITPERNRFGDIGYDVHLYGPDGEEIEFDYEITTQETPSGEIPVLIINPMGLFQYISMIGNHIVIRLGSTQDGSDLYEVEYEILIEQEHGNDPKLRIREYHKTLTRDDENASLPTIYNSFASLLCDDSDSDEEEKDEIEDSTKPPDDASPASLMGETS